MMYFKTPNKQVNFIDDDKDYYRAHYFPQLEIELKHLHRKIGHQWSAYVSENDDSTFYFETNSEIVLEHLLIEFDELILIKQDYFKALHLSYLCGYPPPLPF